ncbi:MAG: endonuclease/exonuclease/phosphatase family protein [Bacteroidia bacterium]
MTKVTIATFNCENLFRRYKFTTKAKPETIKKANEQLINEGVLLNEKFFTRIIDEEKKLTAQAILATNADIIALQEVENLETLKSFVSNFLKNKGYHYQILIDGNDMRLIDVALISKIPFTNVRTNQFLKGTDKKNVFSRDCLEVDFEISGKPLTLFVNHFKSMMEMGENDPVKSRAATKPKREKQSKAVVDILNKRFNNQPEKHNWIMMGDLNDYPDAHTGLDLLLKSGFMENVLDRLPKTERWTHFWDTSKVKEAEKYKQIDYLFLSKTLAQKNKTVKPIIVRNGLSPKAKKATDPRFTGVTDKIVASDHCPVAITLEI